MDSTCPACRHVLVGPEGTTLKCPNCGERVTLKGPDPALVAGPAPAPAAPWPDPTAPLALPEKATGPTVRPASTAALVLGLLFFIPLLTQVVALIVGLVAVCRKRQERERVTAAWVGMVLALGALAAWIFILPAAWSRGRMFAVGPVVFPGSVMEGEGDILLSTGELKAKLEQIHRAATTYRRDFGRWPVGVDSLVGHSLPRGFKLSKQLEYRSPPDVEEAAWDWVLVLSNPLVQDAEGEPLPGPRRLILRLDGRIELLTEEETKNLIDSEDAGRP